MPETQNNARLLSTIKRHEGFSPVAYPDRASTRSPGTPTVGHGINVGDPAIRELTGLTPDSVVSEERSSEIWDTIIIPQARKELRGGFLSPKAYDSLDATREGAIVNAWAQMGLGSLRGFVKMRAALESGDYEEAARQLLDSDYGRRFPTRAGENAKKLLLGDELLGDKVLGAPNVNSK